VAKVFISVSLGLLVLDPGRGYGFWRFSLGSDELGVDKFLWCFRVEGAGDVVRPEILRVE
jgi:hypothetical protein